MIRFTMGFSIGSSIRFSTRVSIGSSIGFSVAARVASGLSWPRRKEYVSAENSGCWWNRGGERGEVIGGNGRRSGPPE